MALVLVIALGAPSAFAGDLMNVEFLQKHALQSDKQIQEISRALNALNTPKSPSKGIFVLNAISNGLFTATYYITNVPVYYVLGGVAGGLFYAPYPYDFHKGRKAHREIQRAAAALEVRTAEVSAKVETLYRQWKQDADPTVARRQLVGMTSENVVQEIETSLRLEALLVDGETINPQTGTVPGPKLRKTRPAK